MSSGRGVDLSTASCTLNRADESSPLEGEQCLLLNEDSCWFVIVPSVVEELELPFGGLEGTDGCESG